MNRIDEKRWLLSTLAAGALLLVASFLLRGPLGNEITVGVSTAAGSPDEAMQWVGYVAAHLVIGGVIAWMYAAIRPRYGAGAGTAARAGFAAWFLIVLTPGMMTLILQAGTGVSTGPLFWVIMGSLPLYVATALLAGWVYTEQTQPRAGEATVEHAHA